jgi:hypothetical protein
MKTALFFIAVAAVGAPFLARAQSATPNHDRVRTFLVLRLAEQLDLSDEKALQISAIMRHSDDRRGELKGQRDQIEKQLSAALAQTPADDAAIGKLVAQANDVDHQLSQLPETAYLEIQKTLTLQQQAKLVLFRPELQRQIRGALRKRLEGGGGGGGGGGGWLRRHAGDG